MESRAKHIALFALFPFLWESYCIYSFINVASISQQLHRFHQQYIKKTMMTQRTHNKQIRKALLLLFSFSTLQSIDPLSLVAGPAIKETVDKVKEYIYAEQTEHKRILKKHLGAPSFRSAIVDGCNERFTQDCAELAQHFEAMEKYHADSNEMWCLKYQTNIVQKDGYAALETELFAQSELLRQERSDIWSSYFQSLSPDEQKKLLALQRKLIIEHAQPQSYKQELENLHAAFTQRN
jgi:hypothetical protein